MSKSQTLAQRMALVGIPLEDALWYHRKAAGTGFKSAEEVNRAREILWTVSKRAPR